MNKVDKWCTYGVWGRKIPDHLGKVIELSDDETKGVLLYSEGQLYAPEYWDMAYVMMFDDIEDAIFYLATQGTDQSINSIKEYFNFMKTVEKKGIVIDWDSLKKKEIKHYNLKRY
jgi:hypothetical protein